MNETDLNTNVYIEFSHGVSRFVLPIVLTGVSGVVAWLGQRYAEYRQRKTDNELKKSKERYKTLWCIYLHLTDHKILSYSSGLDPYIGSEVEATSTPRVESVKLEVRDTEDTVPQNATFGGEMLKKYQDMIVDNLKDLHRVIEEDISVLEPDSDMVKYVVKLLKYIADYQTYISSCKLGDYCYSVPRNYPHGLTTKISEEINRERENIDRILGRV